MASASNKSDARGSVKCCRCHATAESGVSRDTLNSLLLHPKSCEYDSPIKELRNQYTLLVATTTIPAVVDLRCENQGIHQYAK